MGTAAMNQAKEQSQPSESDLFRLVVEAAPNAMIMVDTDGLITFVNTQTEGMFGYPRTELIGKPVEILLNKSLRERHIQYRNAYMLAPETRAMGGGRELLGLRKDGTEFPVEIGLNPLPTPQGMRVLAAVVDISERRRAEGERYELEERVRHSQKLESLGVLAGGIAHDFNNLLAAILGNAELAATQIPDDSSAHPYIQHILSASRRAAELIRQMLAYSGRGRFELRRLNASKAVEEMGELLRVSMAKKTRVRFEFGDALPEIEVDPAQFNQVVMNLITNANEALHDREGDVSVSTGLILADHDYLSACVCDDDVEAGPFVYVEVSDSGSGMDAETLARIFDPFYSTKFTGRGLGLSAVLGIVRGHNGAIRVDSETGKGTTMRVLFPALGSFAETPSPVVIDGWRGQGLVLVADDEEPVRAMTCAQLESMGFATVQADDGTTAIARALENADSLVLAVLDLTMPELDGDEAARQILAANPSLPIVLASGYSAQDLSKRLRDQPNVLLLQKPFSLADMKATVRAALGQ